MHHPLESSFPLIRPGTTGNKRPSKSIKLHFYIWNLLYALRNNTCLLDREKDLERLRYLSLESERYLRLSLERDLGNKINGQLTETVSSVMVSRCGSYNFTCCDCD